MQEHESQEHRSRDFGSSNFHLAVVGVSSVLAQEVVVVERAGNRLGILRPRSRFIDTKLETRPITCSPPLLPRRSRHIALSTLPWKWFSPEVHRERRSGREGKRLPLFFRVHANTTLRGQGFRPPTARNVISAAWLRVFLFHPKKSSAYVCVM